MSEGGAVSLERIQALLVELHQVSLLEPTSDAAPTSPAADPEGNLLVLPNRFYQAPETEEQARIGPLHGSTAAREGPHGDAGAGAGDDGDSTDRLASGADVPASSVAPPMPPRLQFSSAPGAPSAMPQTIAAWRLRFPRQAARLQPLPPRLQFPSVPEAPPAKPQLPAAWRLRFPRQAVRVQPEPQLITPRLHIPSVPRAPCAVAAIRSRHPLCNRCGRGVSWELERICFFIGFFAHRSP